MIAWPEPLVAELAARRCIPFLGSGASAASLSQDETKRAPTWVQLLTALRAVHPRAADQALLDKLIGQEKYLDAAEVILDSINGPEFATFLRDTLVVPRFAASAVHQAILTLDPKTLITTNWDDIYDRYCQTGDALQGYQIIKHYDDQLVSGLRSPVRLIVKAHGCVSDPSKVVFTRSQYFAARQKYALFYKVLDSLFLTNTILFIGYSLSDPDIQLVLENATIASPSSHPHYAIVPSGTHPSLKKAIETAYNIQMLEHDPGDYAGVEASLKQLATAVDSYRANYKV